MRAVHGGGGMNENDLKRVQELMRRKLDAATERHFGSSLAAPRHKVVHEKVALRGRRVLAAFDMLKAFASCTSLSIA